MGNPYGRLLTVMKSQAEKAADSNPWFTVGTMLTGAQIKLPGRVLARDDYILLYNDFTIGVDGETQYFSVPFKSKQKKVIKAALKDTDTGGSKQQTITIKAIPFEKGDQVLCAPLNDARWIVFGKVAEIDDR